MKNIQHIEQCIYANPPQKPTHKANAGAGMRRCKRSLYLKKKN
jgi:hypothetical protein